MGRKILPGWKISLPETTPQISVVTGDCSLLLPFIYADDQKKDLLAAWMRALRLTTNPKEFWAMHS